MTGARTTAPLDPGRGEHRRGEGPAGRRIFRPLSHRADRAHDRRRSTSTCRCSSTTSPTSSLTAPGIRVSRGVFARAGAANGREALARSDARAGRVHPFGSLPDGQGGRAGGDARDRHGERRRGGLGQVPVDQLSSAFGRSLTADQLAAPARSSPSSITAWSGTLADADDAGRSGTRRTTSAICSRRQRRRPPGRRSSRFDGFGIRCGRSRPKGLATNADRSRLRCRAATAELDGDHPAGSVRRVCEAPGYRHTL